MKKKCKNSRRYKSLDRNVPNYLGSQDEIETGGDRNVCVFNFKLANICARVEFGAKT